MIIVMMGVSGSGKSTLAGALAEAEGWDFQEGDALHPAANIARMRAGHPLDDDGRQPWLDRVAAWISSELKQGRNGVVTCSALKRAYRERLRRAGDSVRFVYIRVSRDTLEKRLRHRDHFMPASLLDSQIDTLQPPVNEADTLIVSGEKPVDESIDELRQWIAQQNHRDR